MQQIQLITGALSQAVRASRAERLGIRSEGQSSVHSCKYVLSHVHSSPVSAPQKNFGLSPKCDLLVLMGGYGQGDSSAPYKPYLLAIQLHCFSAGAFLALCLSASASLLSKPLRHPKNTATPQSQEQQSKTILYGVMLGLMEDRSLSCTHTRVTHGEADTRLNKLSFRAAAALRPRRSPYCSKGLHCDNCRAERPDR